MFAGVVLLTVALSGQPAIEVGFDMYGPDDVGWHEWGEEHEVHNPNENSTGLFARINRRMVQGEPRMSVTVVRPVAFHEDAQSTWLERDAADSLFEGLAMAYRAIWGTWPRFMRIKMREEAAHDGESNQAAPDPRD